MVLQKTADYHRDELGAAAVPFSFPAPPGPRQTQ